MLKFILVEKCKNGELEFHYDDTNNKKEDAISMTAYDHDANIIEAFSFNECLRLLNERGKYIHFLKRSKAKKTILKGKYAEKLIERIDFLTLFDFEKAFKENAFVTYTVYKDKRNFKVKLNEFLRYFDFDRAFKIFIGTEDDPGYLKTVNDKECHDDFIKEKDRAFEMTESAFMKEFKFLWNKHSEKWLDYDAYKPIIDISKIGL